MIAMTSIQQQRSTTQRRSAEALFLGGVVLCIASLLPWSICSDSSCGGSGGLMAFFDLSGLDAGWGLVTLASGLVAVGLAVRWARRTGGHPEIVLLAAVLSAMAEVAHVVQYHVVLAHGMVGPVIGMYLAIAATIWVAVAGAWRHRWERLVERSANTLTDFLLGGRPPSRL
jgi:hypothetical protein